MSAEYPFQRRLGAFPLRSGHTEFRVWAPVPAEVRLRAGGADHALEHVGHGIYEAALDVPSGTDYQYVIDGEALPTRARAGSRRACAARRACSTRTRSRGATTPSARPASTTP